VSGDPAAAALAALPCGTGAPRLTDAEVAAYLGALPGWTLRGGALVKEFRFPDYRATIAFVNEVAEIAQRADHHPDLSVHYDRCNVRWTTHDAGGVTANDVACAARVEGLRP
jgi:4a-hydroxytetrahydrobiopterin dehydratase